uniref:Uncharacterized protein n=2 Tax=Oryza sativa subsp. japonica TaxID=39947 RepID=A0A5S6RA24_ORYSJ|nr:hypothetical protein [Oryza sativa Japonica Group]AAP54298.1 hypothetical protein LOC_Os10g33950 [Oryza sativa Japonica Group]
MVRTGTMLREKQRSIAVGIPCEKVTRVWILGGQLRSTVGIGTRLREELRSRRSRIPGNKVGYKMAYGGWKSCGRDLCNGLHERSNRQLTGGQTGGIAAVRPAGARRSDRRRRQVRQATSAIRPEIQHRSDRRHPLGQTGRSISVRPTSVDFEGNFYFR